MDREHMFRTILSLLSLAALLTGVFPAAAGHSIGAESGTSPHPKQVDVNWQFDTVDHVGNVGTSSSLALDPAGHPHIAYYQGPDYGEGILRYAYHDGANWHIETVDNQGWTGDSPSLKLDGAGRPRIAYRNITNNDLQYAYYGCSP